LRCELCENCFGFRDIIQQQPGFADLADHQTRVKHFFVRSKCLTRTLEVTKRNLILPFLHIQITEGIAGNADAIQIAVTLV
jgi:hypothetical protein